jgi:hypothetical protein
MKSFSEIVTETKTAYLRRPFFKGSQGLRASLRRGQALVIEFIFFDKWGE